jgi:hypothetical protein
MIHVDQQRIFQGQVRLHRTGNCAEPDGTQGGVTRQQDRTLNAIPIPGGKDLTQVQSGLYVYRIVSGQVSLDRSYPVGNFVWKQSNGLGQRGVCANINNPDQSQEI